MARNKSKAEIESHEVTSEQTPGLTKAAEAANLSAAIQADYNENRDLVNQMLGQIQMSRAISKFTDVVSLSKLKQIKETKMYRAAAGQKMVGLSGEDIADVGTWAGFCQALGVSASKIDEDLTNLDAFGEDALKQLNSIGVGYRELRQYRRLPQDERAALIEAAKVGDKDELLELAESLISKHAKEKEALTVELTEVQSNYEAQGAVIKKKDEKLNTLEKQLHKQRNRAGDWHPRASEIAIETTRHAAETLEALDKLETMRNAILTEEFGEADRDTAIEAMAVVYYDAVSQIAGRLAEVMADCEEVFVGYKEKARPMLDVEAFQPNK
jgi:hypothetical protein